MGCLMIKNRGKIKDPTHRAIGGASDHESIPAGDCRRGQVTMTITGHRGGRGQHNLIFKISILVFCIAVSKSLFIMTEQNETPTWLPISRVWFLEPLSQSGETWKRRLKTVISSAKDEIDRVTTRTQKNEVKLSKDLTKAKGDIKIYKRKMENLKKANENLKNELESKDDKVNTATLASFINEMNSEHYHKTIEENRKQISALKDLLLKQKENTATDEKHKYNLILTELNALKLSYNAVKKANETAMNEKEELKKRILELAEENIKAEQDSEKIRVLLEDEKKTTERLKMNLRTIAQQLNIPLDFLFLE